MKTDAATLKRVYGMSFVGVYPVMQGIRYLDKLFDELAKGRPREKILRNALLIVSAVDVWAQVPGSAGHDHLAEVVCVDLPPA